jgi:SAM-dependent methyltransferase
MGRSAVTAKFVEEYGRDTPPPLEDGRLDAAAFHRNSGPILNVLRRVLGGQGGQGGHVLEIGSGTGQHIVAFSRALPALTWWPSDPKPVHRRSIEAWARHSGLGNVRPPVEIDAAARGWPLGQPGYPPTGDLAGIVCINVIHIAPWAVAEGVMAAAGRHLRRGGCLVLYGPYAMHGAHTADSNAAFDASLRAQDPQWGVRDTDDIAALAAANGLGVVETVAMPANNLTLVLSRDANA